jgi:DNA-binding protein H-NS
LFHGRDDENSANFIRSLEGYIAINHITDEAIMIMLLGTFISAGSDADVWWMGLGASHKATWASAKAEFLAKWPAIVVAGKTQREYQKELLELRFKEEEVGERVTVAGIATWAHIQFHNKLTTLVKDAGVESVPILIQPVRDALPRALKDLISAAPADWKTFLNEIKNVNIDTLQEKAKRVKERKEAERAQNARIARLENRQDPIEVLRLQMQQTTIGSNTLTPKATAPPRAMGNAPPSTMMPRRAVRYITANQPTTNQYPRGQPPTQEEKDALRTYINELQHHADTDTGHMAYGEQLRQWTAKWGEGARCTEKTPFPLTPGTAQICSGECFRCGAHGHIGPRCPIPRDAQLPKNESIWRSNCTRILGTFNRAIAPQVNLVMEETLEQGNGSGSLA